MRFERHSSEIRVILPLFVGVHLNRKVLEKEWIHGTLKMKQTSRAEEVRKHLEICSRCRQEVENLEQEKEHLLEDGKSQAAGY